MHSIELKFDIHIIDHHRTNPYDFAECITNSFRIGLQKIILIHYGLWGQFIKIVLVFKRFIQFISNMVVPCRHNRTYCADFEEFKIYSSFTGE